MTLTLAQVHTWQPDAVAGLADALTARRRDLLAALDELDQAAPPSSWTGSAATAATGNHRDLRSGLEEVTQEVTTVINALDEGADQIRTVVADLTDVLDRATGQGARVDLTSGTVHATDAGTDLDPHQIADQLSMVWHSATQADAILARSLHAAATVLSTAGPDAPDLDVLPPPHGASEEDVSRWWHDLDPAEQKYILEHHPEWIGNLDGIPAWARDDANRSLLPAYRAELQASYDRLLDLALATPGNSFLFIQAGLIEKKLAGLEEVTDVLDRGDRQLLVLDTSGAHELRAAVAIGDVDTADSVGVFTPGFDANVRDSLAGYDSSMAALADLTASEALRQGRVQTVATVTWLGYEAPQSDAGLLLPSRSVLSSTSAQTGGEDLSSFLRGVDASRAEDAHVVPMGYSYGSTVTGYALTEQTGADAAVVLGSPGVGTSDASDLQVPEGSTYMIEARRDAVADTGWFGRDPSHMDGVTGLSARDETIGGVTYTESVGHSDYLTEGSTSQYNLAQILAGQPEYAVEHHGRGIGDWFSRPLW